MVSIDTFRELALALKDTEELPHFEKTSFRIRKKIFATLAVASAQACVKLSPIDQSAFCSFDKTAIYPVPNKWGQQGWTMIELKKVRKDMLKDALHTAYHEVLAGKKKKRE